MMQLFLLEKHITLSSANIVPMVAVVFRSFASMLIDIICAIYLGVTGVGVCGAMEQKRGGSSELASRAGEQEAQKESKR